MNTILKFKNCWLPLQNNLFSIALIAMFASTGLITTGVYAYDGDVDFLAPYLTVDPETGKLVTIDPRAQTTVVHEASADTSDEILSTTVDAPPTQTASVSAQTTQEIMSAPATGQSESPQGSNMPLIAGLIIGLLAISFFFYSKQKKSVVDSETDTGNS
ncbi:MAG: hypothetical protein ACI9XC_001421 [Gammaproteobacteria bacterium]